MSDKRSKKVFTPDLDGPERLPEEADLRLYWIAFQLGYETDVEELLEDFDIDDFTRWEDVHADEGVPSPAPGIWPELGGLIMFTAPAELESMLTEEIHRLCRRHPGEAVRLIVHPHPAGH